MSINVMVPVRRVRVPVWLPNVTVTFAKATLSYPADFQSAAQRRRLRMPSNALRHR